ncbi:MAG TPA: serine hydrolase, partial [Eudoraea sp.]|nr:serine hydrolase [Eudoraea sp.]
NRYKLAGGGYLSTSEDIARLGQACLDKKIADPAVISSFLRSHRCKGKPTWYGLGWEVSEDKKGRPYYGHVGNGVGGYANFFVYPGEQMVISMVINCTNPMVQEVLDEVIDHLILQGSTSPTTP